MRESPKLVNMVVVTPIKEAPSRRAGQRIRLATPAERCDLADYLRICGWSVENVGRRDLRARYPFAHDDDCEKVSLRFSVAVWRTMQEASASEFLLATG